MLCTNWNWLPAVIHEAEGPALILYLNHGFFLWKTYGVDLWAPVLAKGDGNLFQLEG